MQFLDATAGAAPPAMLPGVAAAGGVGWHRGLAMLPCDETRGASVLPAVL